MLVRESYFTRMFLEMVFWSSVDLNLLWFSSTSEGQWEEKDNHENRNH